ncbi:TrgA family protein [Shimia abyssi]|uniref:Tellurium resistance protein n=1 Tax=Shimia abyssi TaxID=1662395 RepID=A0A2P8F6A4_9RHOB|nr:TrgA family protein [Shimia abyssi]PSL17250.1 hypothetical protein CLV88_11920 [Shimia abyssi]
MLTANKLVAALSLAILGAMVAELIKPSFPEGFDAGNFTILSAGLGLIVGWRVLGRRAGRGTAMALNNGITGVVAFVAVGLLFFGAEEMLDRALNRRYEDPIVAIQQIVEIAMEYSFYLLDPPVLIALGVGAILSGLAAEYAFHRWR